MNVRVGYGWDSHVFTPGVPLYLGGLHVESKSGLAGHSDGDVLLHAICDALLGALALGDIGRHFPPTSAAFHGARSHTFVEHATKLVRDRGWEIANVDSTVVMLRPHLDPIRERIQASIAKILAISVERVSVKAKTPEGMGLDHAAMAHAVALLFRPDPKPDAMSGSGAGPGVARLRADQGPP
jgi:2-C-methyl-D-erythritol 2,4-cyclodiphosphate synthase